MSASISLQLALAGEHAAIYGYGVVGPRLKTSQANQARSARNSHRAARDQLERRILAGGGQPVVADSSYVVDVDGASQQKLRAILTSIEDRLCELYATVVLEPDDDARRLGIDQMQATAVRATQWRGSALTFPGLQEPPPQS